MGRERKYESVLSWADEVEKEEEDALKQKLNPFGSARPREVVLQERGVDWRKLDLDLQQTSNLRNRARNEKKSKENIPAPNARANAKKQCEVPWVPLVSQSQIPVIFSPPLRYPHQNPCPRFVEESSICYNLYGSDNWQQNFQCKNGLENENENACNKRRLRTAHRLDPISHNIHPRLDLQMVEFEELGLPSEAPRNGKRFRKPAICKNQQDRSSAYERRAPLLRQDDYGRQDRIDYQGVNDSRMERTLSAEFEREIIGLENERQKVGGMVTGPFTAAAGNGRRVGATQNMKMNIASCGVNRRRRGIELGSNKSGNHRKRT
ncbi:hypothetical protein SLA2020_423540 [Shorea laevis]